VSQKLSSVCVFCGARPGARPEYLEAAMGLGALLARRGVGVVYGGASVGLMGALAKAALDGGGRVVGVIPQKLVERELAHPALSELITVQSMHERKALMGARADAFIALPGGFGTFEELFEVITWSQIGLHHKPIGLLDVGGYFGAFRMLVEQGVREGFIPAEHATRIAQEVAPEVLLERLEERALRPGPFFDPRST